MADDFPSIQLPSHRKASYKKKTLKTQFDSGHIQSAPLFTKGMWVYELAWDAIPFGDFYSVQYHFEQFAGDTFTVSGDMLGTTDSMTMAYTNDEVASESSGIKGYVKFTIVLEQRS